MDMADAPQKPAKPNVIEMAKKQRHIHLYSQIQKGKALKPSELKELAKLEGQVDEPGVVDTLEQVAKVFGVTVRSVDYWVKEGMPKRPDGRYSLKDIQEWKFLKHQEGGGSPGKKSKGSHWDEEYRKFKALGEEIRYKKEIGELVPRAEIEEGLIQITVAIKRAFLGLPRSMAPKLAGLEPREVEVLLTSKIKSIIAMFYEDRIFKGYAQRNQDKKKSPKKKSNAQNPGSAKNLD